MVLNKKISVLQVLPDLNSGGVERGTLEVNKYLVSIGCRSMVISDGGRMVEELERDKGEHYKLGVGKKNLFTILTIFKLINFIKKNKIDIIHARSRLPAWVCYFALKLTKKNKRPIFITTVHGPYSVNFYSSIMTKGDRVIVVSKMIRYYVLKNFKVDKNKLVLNYRGVSKKYFPYNFKAAEKWLKIWQKDFPQTKNKIILTLPARITGWKGQEDFIILLKKIIEKNPNVHGLIVGEVKNKARFVNKLKSQATKLGVNKNLTFVGHRSDIREIISISKIVFSLSREPEAFGRISLESLTMGIPVIAYAHGGVKEQMLEILPEGLVAVGNINLVASLTKKWLKNRPEINKGHSFTLKNMLEKTVLVYQQAIKDKCQK